MSADPARAQRGFSLVELVMAISVMGIALAGAVAIFATTARQSANPMVQAQAQLIAEAYLDEMLIKRFYDPESLNVCPAAEVGGRSAYDNVCDYNGLVGTPQDQLGTPIGALSAYTVQVTVDNAGVSLNGLNNTAPTAQIRVLLVSVTVTGPGSVSVVLSGYRTNYACNTTGDPGCVAL